MDASGGLNDTFDFDSFINYPEESTLDVNDVVDFQFPCWHNDSNVPAHLFDMHFTPNMDFSPYDPSVNSFDTVSYPSSSVNESPQTTTSQDFFAPQAEDFRPLVESWASVDQRARSMKEKRRDAAIDLHLKRFVKSHSEPQSFVVPDWDSSISHKPSMTCSYTSAEQNLVGNTSASSTPPNEHSTRPVVAGRELVFDINLNTATQLPKKQKKRTRAQIEDYINARRNGACLMHKKQHKKCNCHEKQSMKLSAMDVKARTHPTPATKVAAPRPKAGEKNVLQTLPTYSGISSSPSALSKLDGLLSEEEIEPQPEPWEDLADWERWFTLDYATCRFDAPQQASRQALLHDGPPRLRHHNVDAPEESASTHASVEHSPVLNAPVAHIPGIHNRVSDSGSRSSGLLANTGVFSENLHVTRNISGLLHEPLPAQTSAHVKDSASSKMSLPRLTKTTQLKASLAPLNFLGSTILQQSGSEWSPASQPSTAFVPQSRGLSVIYALAASTVTADHTIALQSIVGSAAPTSAIDLRKVIGGKPDATTSFTTATDSLQTVSLGAQQDLHIFRDAISWACHFLIAFLGVFIASLQSISQIALLWRSAFSQCISQKRSYAGREGHLLRIASTYSCGRRLLPLQI